MPSFKKYPIGSVIGSGTYKFREYSSSSLIFTYTGSWEYKTSDIVALLTSGTLTIAQGNYDVFLVGGGGGSSTYYNGFASGAGGGGGYTLTQSNVALNGSYSVTIGAGGAANSSSSTNGGGTTSAFGYSAAGAKSQAWYIGGDGGSGGGGGYDNWQSVSTGGVGGSNGANGQSGRDNMLGGKGQGTTTYAFGESSTGLLYAGGGGGYPNYAGGAGGGANYQTDALPNTGGGAGGYGHSGGSGIVLFRLHK